MFSEQREPTQPTGPWGLEDREEYGVSWRKRHGLESMPWVPVLVLPPTSCP